MNKYKVVIIDDDEVTIGKLSDTLKKNLRFSTEETARSDKQGKKLIVKIQPDLLFLDVEMSDAAGLDLLHGLRDSIPWNIQVVFYTAYKKYMIHAIRESVFDYLLRPFEKQELEYILTRFITQVKAEQKRSLPIGASLYVGQTFIVFTPTSDIRTLHPAGVAFFRYRAERKQWEVILNTQSLVVLRCGMTTGQIIKYPPSLVQIHQSYIINIDYLMIMKDNKCMLYPPFDNVTELFVSRKYKKELQDRSCL